MKTGSRVLLLLVLIAIAGCHPIPVPGTLSYGHFPELALYRHSARPAHVAVFISGDGGWNGDLALVSEDLTKMGYLVIGVGIDRYLEMLEKEDSSCVELASDYLGMVRHVEENFGYERFVKPVVIGHSAGASMAYGILMQSRPGTFRGGVSIGFSPGYESPKPFCSRPGLASTWNDGTGEYDLQPGGQTVLPWVAIHGTTDTVCPIRDAAAFVQSIQGAKFVRILGVGHVIRDDQVLAALKKALHEIAG